MICRCFGRAFDLGKAGQAVRAAAELVAGLPDYDAYLRHHAATHAEQVAMTRDAFFRARQVARFGAGGGLRCC